jgi:hypothetical protein
LTSSYRVCIFNKKLEDVIYKVPENAIETEGGYFWLEDGIVHIHNKPTNKHSLRDAQIGISMSRSIGAGVKRPLIIDMTDIRSIDRQAREAYAAAGSPEYVTAVALITRTTLSTVIGNFFIGFNQPAVPTRLFSDYSPALAWVKNLMS